MAVGGATGEVGKEEATAAASGADSRRAPGPAEEAKAAVTARKAKGRSPERARPPAARADMSKRAFLIFWALDLRRRLDR